MPIQSTFQATETVKTPSRPSAEITVPQLKPAMNRTQAQTGKLSETPPQAVQPDAKPVTQPAVPVPAGKPVLKVDGIAYQDSDVESFAMVNGVAVSKGSVIEGARVEEIQKDRVKFSRGGEKFEVILEKSN
jgi:type II secretory pathway component PulC